MGPNAQSGCQTRRLFRNYATGRVKFPFRGGCVRTGSGRRLAATVGANRQRVVDSADANFFHRHALELVRGMSDSVAVDARERAAAQLLRPLGRDIDEEEATGDRDSALPFFGRTRIRLICVVRHAARVAETSAAR